MLGVVCGQERVQRIWSLETCIDALRQWNSRVNCFSFFLFDFEEKLIHVYMKIDTCICWIDILKMGNVTCAHIHVLSVLFVILVFVHSIRLIYTVRKIVLTLQDCIRNAIRYCVSFITCICYTRRIACCTFYHGDSVWFLGSISWNIFTRDNLDVLSIIVVSFFQWEEFSPSRNKNMDN